MVFKSARSFYIDVFSGASHADDLAYIFKAEYTPEVKNGSKEDITIRRISKLWTNFAKTGDPNSKNKNELLSVHWKAATKAELNFLDIDETLTASINPDGDRMTFWDNIYEKYLNR